MDGSALKMSNCLVRAAIEKFASGKYRDKMRCTYRDLVVCTMKVFWQNAMYLPRFGGLLDEGILAKSDVLTVIWRFALERSLDKMRNVVYLLALGSW